MHGLFRFGAFALVLLLAAGCASAPAGDGGARPGERRRTATSIAAHSIAQCDRILYNSVNSAIHGAISVNTISANDLKTKGVSAIEQALAVQPEASVTVRGQVKYVVMSREEYTRLRECELEAALAESKADVDAGRFVTESVEQHVKRLAKLRV